MRVCDKIDSNIYEQIATICQIKYGKFHLRLQISYILQIYI